MTIRTRLVGWRGLCTSSCGWRLWPRIDMSSQRDISVGWDWRSVVWIRVASTTAAITTRTLWTRWTSSLVTPSRALRLLFHGECRWINRVGIGVTWLWWAWWWTCSRSSTTRVSPKEPRWRAGCRWDRLWGRWSHVIRRLLAASGLLHILKVGICNDANGVWWNASIWGGARRSRECGMFVAIQGRMQGEGCSPQPHPVVCIRTSPTTWGKTAARSHSKTGVGVVVIHFEAHEFLGRGNISFLNSRGVDEAGRYEYEDCHGEDSEKDIHGNFQWSIVSSKGPTFVWNEANCNWAKVLGGHGSFGAVVL